MAQHLPFLHSAATFILGFYCSSFYSLLQMLAPLTIIRGRLMYTRITTVRRRFGLILMQHVMSVVRVPIINVNITRPGIGPGD